MTARSLGARPTPLEALLTQPSARSPPDPRFRSAPRSPDCRNCGGSIPIPTPLGVPVRIRSPGTSVHVSRDEPDELLATEDQIRGAAVLAQLPVDPGPQAQVLRLLDLVDRGDPGPERAERVGALGPRPLRLAALEVTCGDVIGDAVAGDPSAGAHDDRQLALVVKPAHHLWTPDRSARRRRGSPDLDEDERRFGCRRARLGTCAA